MTEIATTGITALVAATDAPPAVSQLMQHAQAMKVAYDLAQAMCASELVPAIYRGRPENGAAAILYGLELGLNPIQSLQQIFVVHGTPAIYARTMVALVMAKGHQVWVEESGDTGVTVCGRRLGEEHTHTATWTIERAKLAGFTSNKKYLSEPQAMLYAKAAAEVCRKMAPDVLLGIAYTREDLELDGDRQAPTTARPPARGAGARGVAGVREKLGLQAAPRPEPEAAVPAAPPVETPAAPAAAPASNSQLQKVNILLKEVEGLTEAGDKLAWLAEQFKRPFTSSKELTKDEATELLVWLEQQRAADAQAAG